MVELEGRQRGEPHALSLKMENTPCPFWPPGGCTLAFQNIRILKTHKFDISVKDFVLSFSYKALNGEKNS